MFSKETITQYTCADCWALAIELHRRTGLPVVVFGFEDGFWHHFALKIDNWTVLDVRGIRSYEDIHIEFSTDDTWTVSDLNV